MKVNSVVVLDWVVVIIVESCKNKGLGLERAYLKNFVWQCIILNIINYKEGYRLKRYMLKIRK